MSYKFCPDCGKRTRWPKYDPYACSMKCAAQSHLSFYDGLDAAEMPYCPDCGKEAFDCPCGNEIYEYQEMDE
jgi:membrane protease subunit (stomatin/prohibitin family)